MNKVKELREGNAWRISELAKKAGVVSQTVSKMEKGLPTSRGSRLKVARALGKKYKDVFPSDGA